MNLSDVSIHSFIVENGLRTETGLPLTFKDHKFLYDIYADNSDLLCCPKAAQIGFTTMAAIKVMWEVKRSGVDAIYTLPTADDIRSFVSTKVNRIVDMNPVLKGWVGGGDSVERKNVGKSVIHFRGTWTERAALMVTSGLNIHDEIDRSNLDVIEQYESRQQWSPVKKRWVFSNPSTPGQGVDAYWNKSDKKEWQITCSHCGLGQYLRWPDSVDLKGFYRCIKCGGDITESRRDGIWVKTAEGQWSGYHISLLMAPWVTAAEVIRLSREKSPEYFHNFVLGEPYAPKDAKVTRATLEKLLTEGINDQARTVIGCDSGIEKHYVMGNEKGVYFHGKTESWGDIERLMTERKDAVLIVDAMPDITGPRELRETFPGRVFLNYYVKDRKSERIVRWGEGKEAGTVLSDRNRLIQMVVDEMGAGRVRLWGDKFDWEPFFEHWLNMYRVTEINSLGVPEIRWEHNGPDHYCHATALYRVGMDKFGFGSASVYLPSLSPGRPAPEIDPLDGITGKFIMPAERIDHDND